ncbi:universal stress protein [Candidatus Viadribacter manganicus]|uniref:UspA domain-containing protein n=1 Tax=Candidatus Viadribacter manganicus TaxID=1759059 RepID=A0A1B1AH29_9PROT|nr:universal stress protein [Candidatus Viadribacter manganicus]ANP45855.1 hypothetical protein ATE48_07915 [Candidatus Viadribacter manganicus]
MVWRDILVFADGSQEGLSRVALAHNLAHRREAHLEARLITLAPEPPLGETSFAVERAVAALRQAAHERAMSAVRAVEEMEKPGQRFSVYHDECSWGEVAHLGAAAALTSDLAIVAQPREGRDGDLDRRILEAALFRAGTPCLIAPPWAHAREWGRRVIIAWNATPQAAHAVRAALPLLVAAQSVRIVIVDPSPDVENQRALMRLASYLARHGVDVEAPVTTRSSFGEVGRAVLAEAEAYAGDLLVMGAYGHARAFEQVFGGVTHHIIAHASTPVLLAH